MSLAGRMAARGVGEVTRALKPSKEPRGQAGETGLYYQRHLHPVFGRMAPTIELLEMQQPRRFFASVLKNIAIPAAERAFVSGYQALLRGALREARERFTEAYGKDAQFADAYFLHGAVSLEMQDYGEAVHSFKKVLLCQSRLGTRLRKYIPSLRLTLCLTENSSFVFYPDLLGVSVLLSLAHRGRHEDEDAGTVLDQLLGVMPDHPVVGFFLSLHYVETGRWRDVIALLRDTLPDDNISLCNLILLARACTETGDPETALEIFRKILTRTDFDPQLLTDVRFGMAAALATMGRRTEAEEEFRIITTQYPGYMDIFERLGVVPSERRKSAIPRPGTKAASGIPVAVDPVPPPLAAPPPPAASAAVPVVAPVTPPVAPVVAPSEEDEDASPAPVPTRMMDASHDAPAPSPVQVAGGGLSMVSEDGRVHLSLRTSATVIGREEGDVVIDWDTAASRRHACVHVEGGDVWIEDLGSTNGTFVNGHRIGGKVLLNRGDVVTVGQTRMRVQ